MSKDGLYLVTKAKGGSNAGANRITLCTSCNDKHEQRYGRAVQHRSTEEAAAGRVQEGFAAAGWRRVQGRCGAELWRQQVCG